MPAPIEVDDSEDSNSKPMEIDQVDDSADSNSKPMEVDKPEDLAVGDSTSKYLEEDQPEAKNAPVEHTMAAGSAFEETPAAVPTSIVHDVLMPDFLLPTAPIAFSCPSRLKPPPFISGHNPDGAPPTGRRSPRHGIKQFCHGNA